MDLRMLLKKIREEKGMSYQEVGDKIGYSKSYINDVEKGKSASKKLIQGYVKLFPAYEKDILIAYANDKSLGEKFTFNLEERRRGQKVKVYDFISSGNGCVDLTIYKEVEYMLLNDTIEILDNGYAFEVKDKNMEPFFLEGDTLFFLKKEFKNWLELDSKLILVDIDRKIYIKKLFFESGTPYFQTFNTRLFPQEKVEKFKSVKLLGVLNKRLEQDLSNYIF